MIPRMSALQLETNTPSALRRFIAEIATVPFVAPMARMLRSRLSDTKFVTFPLGEMGRFGNQLFQIAATIGIARRNGCSFIFPPWPYARHFEFPIPQSRFIRQFERRMPRTFGYEEIVIARTTERTLHLFRDCGDRDGDWRSVARSNEWKAVV